MLILALTGVAAALAPASAAFRPTDQPSAASARAGGVPAQASAPLPSLIRPDDYPAEAIRLRQQGTTEFRLDIGVDGRVTGCTITASSGSAVLDGATCRILRSRARFVPARDASGRPTTDVFSSRIRWQLPQATAATSQARPIPKRFHSSFVLGADGRARNCELEETMIDRPFRRESETCAPTPPPDGLLAELRPLTEGKAMRFTLSMERIEDSSAPMPARAPAGARLLAHASSRLTIEAGGRVSNCVVLDELRFGNQIPLSPCGTNLQVIPVGHELPAEWRLSVSFFMAPAEATR